MQVNAEIRNARERFNLIGAAVKDNISDLKRMNHYFESEVAQKKARSGRSSTNAGSPPFVIEATAQILVASRPRCLNLHRGTGI